MRILESLLKTGVIMSVPRLLNAFFPLIKAIPDEDSVDNAVVRKDIKNPYDMADRGENYMKAVFGTADMEAFIATMAKYWPDLRKPFRYYTSCFLPSSIFVMTHVRFLDCMPGVRALPV